MVLKKSLGQHLLIADPLLRKTVDCLSPSEEDIIVEIGPGTGNLTKYLIQRSKKVIAIETDPEMVERLKKNLFEFREKLEIVHQDILQTDLSQVVGRGALFAGNLPYNISSPILFKLKANKSLFKRGVVMLQKEVAERIVASPGGKEYGVLSAMLQSIARIKKCFDIGPKAFVPPPKVKSSVLLIDFSEPKPYEIKDEAAFEYLVKSVFQMRRKMLKNSLPEVFKHAAEKSGVELTRRPETLSIKEFIKICDCL